MSGDNSTKRLTQTPTISARAGDQLKVLRAVLERIGMTASFGPLDFEAAKSVAALSASGLKALDQLEGPEGARR